MGHVAQPLKPVWEAAPMGPPRNNYARKLEVGISQGLPVLIENVPEAGRRREVLYKTWA